MLNFVSSEYNPWIFDQLCSQQVAKRMVFLLECYDRSVWNLWIRVDLESRRGVRKSIPQLKAAQTAKTSHMKQIRNTYLGTPSGKMKSSKRSGAFMFYLSPQSSALKQILLLMLP